MVSVLIGLVQGRDDRHGKGKSTKKKLGCHDAVRGIFCDHRISVGGKLEVVSLMVYLASEDGEVIVLKLGEKYEVVATNTLADQVFISSPVIVGGELFLRSQHQLFCISENKAR